MSPVIFRDAGGEDKTEPEVAQMRILRLSLEWMWMVRISNEFTGGTVLDDAARDAPVHVAKEGMNCKRRLQRLGLSGGT